MQDKGACGHKVHRRSCSPTRRSSTDADKLRVYVRIVRLLLEDEDSVQAETFYNRAALLVHSAGNDKETLLQFKLCQARISDYSRKFLEAASRYHELSYTAEIDEDERKFMLYVPYLHLPHITLTLVQIRRSHLRRPRPRWAQSLSHPRLPLPRRALRRASHIQRPLQDVPRPHPPPRRDP